MMHELGRTICFLMFILTQIPDTSEETQVATRKPASQSTTFSNLVASRAVDGDKGDVNMNGCSHTAAGQQTAWWRVDLERLYFIRRILIYPRPLNAYSGRFAGFSLAVSEQEETGYHTCFDFGKNSPLPDLLKTHIVNCTPPARGRYVKISNNRNDEPYGNGYGQDAYVNLCEVEIFVEGCGVCSDGLYGERCDRSCPPCGDDGSCNIHSGLCNSNSCRPGFYGDGYKCDKNCSATCGSDRSCDVINGTCLYGCKPGFSGESCEETCTENCVACDQVSRNCTDYGCNIGYHGSFCLSKCSEHCGGNGECSITEGTCASGCNAGWEGSLCLSQVSAKAESGITAAIGAAVGGIIVLASCVIIIIIIVRRRKAKNKQSESKPYMSVPDKNQIKNTEGSLYANVQLAEKMDEDKFTDTNVDNGVSSNDVVLKVDAEESTYYNTA